MEEKIVERVLESMGMFNEKEKEYMLINKSVIAKVYIISTLDTYNTLKDVKNINIF